MNVLRGFQELFVTLYVVSITAAPASAQLPRGISVLLGTILNNITIKHFCREEEGITLILTVQSGEYRSHRSPSFTLGKLCFPLG